MSTATVNGAEIAYQLFGQGPLLVWTEGGRFGRNEFSYMVAGRLARTYTVLLWDRRNCCGASAVALSDAPNWMTDDVEDLHALLHTLALGPACFAGASAGCSLSLWMAYRYPQAVRSLILMDAPTDDTAQFAAGVRRHCFSLATVAERDGMQAALDASTRSWLGELQGVPPTHGTWLAQTVAKNPANRARILALDPQAFARASHRWGAFIMSMGWPAGLSEDAVRAIAVPALVVPGNDEIHPRRCSERLLALLENAETADDAAAVPTDAHYSERLHPVLPAMEAFLARTSGG